LKNLNRTSIRLREIRKKIRITDSKRKSGSFVNFNYCTRRPDAIKKGMQERRQNGALLVRPRRIQMKEGMGLCADRIFEPQKNPLPP
jgi:hypothetical protein